jgi:transcriptional regulator with XRE-family HTH domain
MFAPQERIYARKMTSSAYTICAEARRRSGLSQRALAARAGVSPSTVARIERGRMEPTFELLTRLVEACGQELRIRITEIDWAGRSDWGDMSFEDRLQAVHSASQVFAAQ